MLSVLVTGGAGFLGRALVRCIADNANVIVIDSLDQQVHSSDSFPEDISSRAKCIRAELGDSDSYASEIADVDVVVHLAAQTGTAQSMYDLRRYTDANVSGTAALLETISELGIETARIILASSRAVYGDGAYRSPDGLHPASRRLEDLRAGIWEPVGLDGMPVSTLPMSSTHPTEPISIYGLTKLWQEQLIRSFCAARGLDYSILRLQNVFGPGQALGNPYTGIIGNLTARIAAREEVELFEDGRMTRDFLFVDDAAEMIKAVIEHPGNLEATFDAGSGHGTTLEEISTIIGQVVGNPVIARVSGRFRQGDVRHAVADRSAIDAQFGSLPCTPLKVGLGKYWEWFREQPVPDAADHERALRELEGRGLFHVAAPASGA